MLKKTNQRNIKETFFDFIFAVSGLPLEGSGGARIIVAIINTLQKKNYRIGILSCKREPWFRVLRRDVPLPWIQRLLLKLNDSPLTYRIFNPLDFSWFAVIKFVATKKLE